MTPSRPIGASIASDGAAPIPGLVFRGYRGRDDHTGMLRVWNAAHEGDRTDEVNTLKQFDLQYATLVNCDPTRDLVIAEVDDEIVAYARVFWNDLVEGGRAYECFGFVDPTWRHRGIGSAMLRHNEERLREIAADHPGVEPKWFASQSVDSDPGNRALLANAGYQPVRYFYEMVQGSLETVPEVAMPAGLEVRPAAREQYPQIWEAMREAFRDHWGEAEWSDADWRRFDAEPDNADPALWRVGWDGEEVAGAVLTTIQAEENERYSRARVYVASVSVRRAWRRRGLARALLAASLRAAHKSGFTSASLGVDADSPTGATALYESLGFVPERSSTSYRKPL
jgi:mycothiol synthase